MTYRFGTFCVNSDTRQLFSGDEEVHLSPKAFVLLLTLIEHRDRVLSKAELEEQLWPSSFIGETNLATLVAEVRRGLGESAQDARCIRTIHRVGYRFVAEVRAGGTQPPASQRARMYLRTADRQYPLAEGITIIGRGADATVPIDSGGVSRHHARIVVENGSASIEDLGSKNGTFVRDARIEQPQVLADGDEIRIGPILVTFTRTSLTQATETMPTRSSLGGPSARPKG